MEKTLTQRLNEVNVEAAEMLLEEIKNQLKRNEGPDLYLVNNFADAISKLHVNAEPVDFTAEAAKLMASMNARREPMPGGKPDDYDEKKHSGLIEE